MIDIVFCIGVYGMFKAPTSHVRMTQSTHSQHMAKRPSTTAHHEVTLVRVAGGVALQHACKVNAPIKQTLPQGLCHQGASQQHLRMHEP